MRLYLTRHGLIDYNKGKLDKKGSQYAQELKQKLPDSNIGCICSDIEQRCVNTVKPLAEMLNLKIKTFTKEEFENVLPFNETFKYKCSLICYRIEGINPILIKLGLQEFTEQNRDTAYEFIYDLRIDDGSITNVIRIPTGYKKF